MPQIIFMPPRLSYYKYADYLGTAASLLCAVHCAVAPLFFAARPFFSPIVHSPHSHNNWWGLADFIFLFLSLVAVVWSNWHSDHPWIRWGLWLGWGIFTLGILGEHLHWVGASSWMYIGSGWLIYLHLKHLRYCSSIKTG